MSQADYIERNTNVDAFFLTHQGEILPALSRFENLVSVFQRSAVYGYSLPTHLSKLGRPKMMPKSIIPEFRNSRVESCFPKDPTLLFAYVLGHFQGIVIRELVSKCAFYGMEDVLAVEEGYGTKRFCCNGWLSEGGHLTPEKK